MRKQNLEVRVMTTATPSADPRLYDDDLAPAKERTWGVYSPFAMWMSDIHSVGGYIFAAGLFALGLVGWQVLVAFVIGINLVNVGMNWMGYAGQRTGVPYPVLARVCPGRCTAARWPCSTSSAGSPPSWARCSASS
jgi:nucleobase:cation symporter-1, NCS1 family